MRRLKVHTRVPLYVLAGVALSVALVTRTWRDWGPNIVINPTPSEPMGFYCVVSHEPQEFRRGMTVVFPVPTAFQSLVYGHRWLRNGVPFLKTIVALAGDQVCVFAEHFEVNGRTLGPVYNVDSSGSPMPRIRGCFVIAPDSFFPASTYSPRSFDGRYMGPQPLAALRGEARALWTF
jgi:conjugative transfer signal peptidase TraF